MACAALYKGRRIHLSSNHRVVVVQVLELVILAALAAVVLFQLYAVLGRRVGRGAEEAERAAAAPGAAPTPSVVADTAAPISPLAAIKARDPSFDVGHFLGGAKSAYQMIVTAFAKGDREALRPLLSADVMSGFDAAIAEREGAGREETVEFIHPPRADFETATLAGDIARASVRFLAEFRSRTKGPEGEGVDDRRTAEVWTFERNLKSRNPNWTLIHVDAAEA
jgi:predicted lipid-binding transport protein (Tim44 family)